MGEYDQDWKEYKKARNLFWLVFVSYVPIVMTVAIVSIKLFNTFTPAFILAFIWMVFFVITGMRVNLWRCPRCNKWFSATWWYNLGFLARRCVHCGLPKYQ